MKMFFVAGLGIAVFIEFLLITKKNKSVSDRILTIWMFLISVHLFLLYLNVTGEIYSVPFLLGWDMPLPLVQGVMLYFYTSFLTNQTPANARYLSLHVFPSLAMYIYLIPFFLLPADQKAEVYRTDGAGYETFMIVKHYAIIISGILYVSWSAFLLRNHRKNIQQQFSDLHRVNLRWLQLLTLGMGGIWCLVIFLSNEVFITAGIVMFVFMIAFFGIRQTEIFTPRAAADEEEEPKKKYTKSGLTEETSVQLHQKLTQLMAEEGLYRQSELSITDLASRLGVHPNYLSQIINQKESKNFYEYVNTYRLEEFKRLVAMSKNQQFTLLSLAYDCGFSSKSSFNRYFKKATGKTPSEYSTEITGNQVSPT
jgi:AraC-like DNA-binding protein